MEQLQYNLLYRWFVGLGVDDPVWIPTVFSKNRDRLLKAEVARNFLAELLTHKEVRALLSDEHFILRWSHEKGRGSSHADGCDLGPENYRDVREHFDPSTELPRVLDADQCEASQIERDLFT